MTTVTIRIPEGLRRNLEKLCRRQRRSSSDVVRESLRKYLALEEMNQLREKLRPHAGAAGLLTDDDVFKAVS